MSDHGCGGDKAPPLEMPCTECGGERGDSIGVLLRCEACEGRGKVPTPFGEALLRFIADYTANEDKL